MAAYYRDFEAFTPCDRKWLPEQLEGTCFSPVYINLANQEYVLKGQDSKF